MFLNKVSYYLEERYGNHVTKNNLLEDGLIFKIKIALKSKDVGKSFNYNTNLKFYNEKNILADSLLKVIFMRSINYGILLQWNLNVSEI